jgi:hypothetical protein
MIYKIVLVPAILLLLSVMVIQQQQQQQSAFATRGPWIPFTCDVGGSNCHNDPVISTAPAASSSKADSASAARSQNNVKCFAFCLGVSTANSGAAANSDSRTNSPGDTATAQPVTPRTATIVPFTQPGNDGVKELMVPTAGTQCIDNTGSHQDIGYNQGYVDGQRDFREQRGFDNSLHQHHTDEFKTGYRDGYQAGFDDAQLNVFKNPC